MRFMIAATAAFVFASVAAAQSFLNIDADPAIPTLEATFGYAPGEEITAPADAIAYMEALEAAAPDRVDIHEYAESWEGRPLIYAVMSSPENMARLDEIKGNLDALAAGSGLSAGERDRYAEIMGVKPEWFDRVKRNIADMVDIKERYGLPVTIGMQMVLMPEYADQILPLARLGRELRPDYLVIKHCSDDEDGSLGVDYAA
ncbi:MAG: hypothetical protein RLN72_14010, partial [Henriciella sp.]